MLRLQSWNRKRIKGLILLLLIASLVFSKAEIFASERDGAFTHGEAENKLVALTFDDGPHPRYTEEIMDILDEYDVKATFFFIGENIKYYSKVAKRVADEGHEIGNHTFDHPHLNQISDEELLQEIESTQGLIEEVTGKKARLFRPPEGRWSKERSELIQREMGLYSVLWSVDTLDWKGTAFRDISVGVLNCIKDGDIILCHDYLNKEPNTPQALRYFIPKLKELGYRFVTVSELMEAEGYEFY